MAKAKINAPSKQIDDPLYHSECRMALEPSLTGLSAAAVKAGWPPRVVAYALMILAAEMLQNQPAEEHAVH